MIGVQVRSAFDVWRYEAPLVVLELLVWLVFLLIMHLAWSKQGQLLLPPSFCLCICPCLPLSLSSSFSIRLSLSLSLFLPLSIYLSLSLSLSLSPSSSTAHTLSSIMPLLRIGRILAVFLGSFFAFMLNLSTELWFTQQEVWYSPSLLSLSGHPLYIAALQASVLTCCWMGLSRKRFRGWTEVLSIPLCEFISVSLQV